MSAPFLYPLPTCASTWRSISLFHVCYTLASWYHLLLCVYILCRTACLSVFKRREWANSLVISCKLWKCVHKLKVKYSLLCLAFNCSTIQLCLVSDRTIASLALYESHASWWMKLWKHYLNISVHAKTWMPLNNRVEIASSQLKYEHINARKCYQSKQIKKGAWKKIHTNRA